MPEDLRVVSVRRIHALGEVGDEMERQIDKWGVQEHPSFKHKDLIGYLDDMAQDDRNGLTLTEGAKELCDGRLSAGECSWQDILNEEFLEARDEAIAGNTEGLREELIQVAAVALSWVGSIDRETKRCLQCGLTEGAHKMSCTIRHEG